MKIAVILFLGLVALAHGSPSSSSDDLDPGLDSVESHQAVGGNLDLKMLMVENGTPKGKCYCSCSLNNQPVFMEIDPANLYSYIGS